MYFLTRLFPFDPWRVVTTQPTEGEWVELPACRWVAEAKAEADRLNGKGNSEQGVLKI